MKTIFITLITCLALATWCCKSDNDESEWEQKINNLTATTWTRPTVTNSPDGNLSDSYKSFAMSFTKSPAGGFEGSYIISNGGYAFSETFGLWKLSDDMTKLIFDSGKTMNMTLSDTKLLLDFDVAPPDGGRTDGLSGHFVFEFSR